MSALICRAEDMHRGIFLGTMVAYIGTPTSGLLQAKADGTVYDCAYDANTLIQLNQAPVKVNKLLEGDRLDILVDRVFGTKTCYIRIVRVLPEARSERDGTAKAKAAKRVPAIHVSRTVAGIVIKREGSVATIRTKDGKEVAVVLRPETQYFGNGTKQESSELATNMRVSIQAGTNLAGNLEAVEVIWGSITSVR
jgi:hypothetical protein